LVVADTIAITGKLQEHFVFMGPTPLTAIPAGGCPAFAACPVEDAPAAPGRSALLQNDSRGRNRIIRDITPPPTAG
jgi:hypothetical protein